MEKNRMIVISNKIKMMMDQMKKTNLETFSHCLRVKKIVNKILLQTNASGETSFSSAEIDSICKGALLHDIGKMNVRNYILTKESRLEPDEIGEVRSHTKLGYEAIKEELGEEETEIIRNICLYHHERIDGSGYEKITEIPLYAQIVAVSDVFEALTSERPYHDAVSSEKAIEMIESGECGAFDADVIRYLKNAVGSNNEI